MLFGLADFPLSLLVPVAVLRLLTCWPFLVWFRPTLSIVTVADSHIRLLVPLAPVGTWSTVAAATQCFFPTQCLSVRCLCLLVSSVVSSTTITYTHSNRGELARACSI